MGSILCTKIPPFAPKKSFKNVHESITKLSSRHKEHELSIETEASPIVSEHHMKQPRSQAKRSKTLMVTEEPVEEGVTLKNVAL